MWEGDGERVMFGDSRSWIARVVGEYPLGLMATWAVSGFVARRRRHGLLSVHDLPATA